MNINPMGDRILVKRVEALKKSAGGIIIPSTSQEEPSEGIIIAVGSGVINKNGKIIPLEVKIGDKVLFGKWGGTEIKVDGEDLLIIKESDILYKF